MNIKMLFYSALLSGLLLTCDKQYKRLDELEHFTAINHLSAEQAAKIDRAVFDYINAYSYISVGLIGEGGSVFIRSYGADRIGKTDVYASVTKPVTAMIFFQMLEQGIISSVDDSIAMYSEKYRGVMPGKYIDSHITFKHLLAHQSGILFCTFLPV
jgi:CubicO group peptidase (beta-lactamase class C family)